MTEIEQTIRRYLVASCGNCGVPTDRTIKCFVGMIETGEADIELFRRIGGEYIVRRIREAMQ